MTNSTLAKTATLGLSITLWLAGVQLDAQRGRGGAPPSQGGGHALTIAPGQAAGPASPGMSNRHPEEKSGLGQTDRSAKEAKLGSKDSSQQKTAAERLAANRELSAKLRGLFPEGTDLPSQAEGFKNVGDFVAAAHVSHNLGIPFPSLKGKILGGKSLGQAIHDLKPNVDSAAEAKRATQQSQKLLVESGA